MGGEWNWKAKGDATIIGSASFLRESSSGLWIFSKTKTHSLMPAKVEQSPNYIAQEEILSSPETGGQEERVKSPRLWWEDMTLLFTEDGPFILSRKLFNDGISYSP